MSRKINEKKAITLLEIIVVMIIVGVLSVVSFPAFNQYLNQATANDAQNNLLAIYAAQLNHFNNDASYCVVGACGAGNCATTAGLIACLGISVIENNIVYGCTNAGGFTCTAVSAQFTMTLTNTAPNLTGAFNLATRNPRCTAGTCP